MIKKIAQRGFTLIELLVVIAIIGILAGVVLTSLGTARTSGNDAKIKSQLSSIRAEAEISATSANGSYAGVCAAAASLLVMPGGATAACNSPVGGASWVAHHPLGGVAGRSWCVDHTGASRQVVTTAIGASPVVCPVAG